VKNGLCAFLDTPTYGYKYGGRRCCHIATNGNRVAATAASAPTMAASPPLGKKRDFVIEPDENERNN
jgi:hypothetical protein